MGASCSKNDGNKALLLCKERMRCIKQAVDLRYALSAAQLSYTQSLRNVGAAIRQYAEAEISLHPSNSESPSLTPEMLVSSHDGGLISSPLSNAGYMIAAGSASVKVTVESSPNHHFEEEGEETCTFSVPPPPPFPESCSSWDFFDPVGIKIPNGDYSMRQHFDKFMSLRQSDPLGEEAKAFEKTLTQDMFHSNGVENNLIFKASSRNKSSASKMVCDSINNCSSEGSLESSETNACISIISRASITETPKVDKQKELGKEDASMSIIHEANDLLSSAKDLEHKFIQASEAGHEVSRMLETMKIRLSVHSEILGEHNCFETLLLNVTCRFWFASSSYYCIGKSSDSLLPVLHPLCCTVDKLSESDTIQHVTRVITWNRTVSSRSSSSRNPLILTAKDDDADSGNDFVQEFSMISGSHSSTLERLYAWERKLYDELKASESIRRAYDQKRHLLRRQYAKDVSSRVVDKTRAAVKDLHSCVGVAIQAVDLISRKIEKLRDEELQPQLAELIQGLIRMWKTMLECHQSQHITISSAHHANKINNSFAPYQNSDSYKQAVLNLLNELDCFRSSFAAWFDAQRSYCESLDGWLQKCILQPQERMRGRRVPFSPRRAIAPPMFVLCRDWLAGIRLLPVEEVCDSLKKMMAASQELLEHQKDEKQEDGLERADDGEGAAPTSFVRLQASMVSTFEWLVKFSVESVRVYEGVKQENQTALDAYLKL